MSLDFSKIPTSDYQGSFPTQPISIFQSSKQPPSMIPLNINWNDYGVSNSKPNLAVSVNLALAGVRNKLDAIRGVYIDNTGSDAFIYVAFSDTGFSVACAPGSEIFMPVITNQLQALIIAKNIISSAVPQTRVFFLNIPLSPFKSPELDRNFAQLLSSSTQNVSGRPFRSGNQTISTTGFAIPAMGDNLRTVSLPVQNVNDTSILLNAKQAGFYYLLEFQAIALGISNVELGFGAFVLEGTDGVTNFPINTFNFYAPTAAPPSNGEIIYDLKNMNLCVEGPLDYRLRNLATISTGRITASLVFAFSQF